jgi:hypothetical protein
MSSRKSGLTYRWSTTPSPSARPSHDPRFPSSASSSLSSVGLLAHQDRHDLRRAYRSKRRFHGGSTAADAARATFTLVERAPISHAVAEKLGQAFTVASVDVIGDAERVVAWEGQLDDLLVWLEQRHGWKAEQALRYLVALRSALAGEMEA